VRLIQTNLISLQEEWRNLLSPDLESYQISNEFVSELILNQNRTESLNCERWRRREKI